MAYAQRNGKLLYKPIKLSPRLPPQPRNRQRKPPHKPKVFPPNKNAHPIVQSQAWRGRLLDLQNRNKRPRLANPSQKQDKQISNMSDAQLMNISKGFFEKKPMNRPGQIPPNQVRRNVQPRRGGFNPRGQRRFPYQQSFRGRGGPGYTPLQPNIQWPPNNNPPFQLQPNQGPPLQQPPFRGRGIAAPRGFSNVPVPPQRGLGQPPIQSVPPVFGNHQVPPPGQHPITNTQPAMQQFAPPLPNRGQPMFIPGQPPPPPEPCPTPMPYTKLPPQPILAQQPGVLPPGSPYPTSAGQLQPFVHPFGRPRGPGTMQSIPGRSAAVTINGSVKSSSTVDAAQDYFNSLPKPAALTKKKRKRKLSVPSI